MIKKLILLAVLVGFCLPEVEANVNVNYSSSMFESGRTSTGAFLNDFTFALGVFGNGFVPTTLNESLWASNFNAFGSTTWTDLSFLSGDGTGGFSGTGNLTANDAPFAKDTQIYLFGYNSLTLDSTSEWFLMTNTLNSNWLVPVVPDTAPPSSPSLDIDAAGKFVVLGVLNAPSSGAKTYIQTAKAVPEPSTFAFLGLGLAGLLAARKRRS